ncbi:hydantoinase/oxoprolinase family protein [uncultured Alsobacter sp.]|uniref:hydantoinase/oxoprolinase family protein n=1 Tax=uncultured Alsobacter sp. TaxID=1748258 RepID=UPI0025F01784|nr:hydantoinase/oxoprolinase family protein [uncultured Alsobacter sp.]
MRAFAPDRAVVHPVIGIDTGGTYTDAVIVDAAARQVLSSAKALTTRGDLSIGVAEALAAILSEAAAAGISAADVTQVSLSTTLATNAIVEGHGSSIAVILVGFDDAMVERTDIARTLPGTRILRVAGGHNHAGDEQSPLDLGAVEAFVAATHETCEAYAVASHYAVRNPAHEHAVREAIERLTGRPASLSADLAQALDAPRRALTAALNARIVGRITSLIAAVRRAMAAHGLAAPLMMVKGDGSLAPADAVALRPIETILSGPAASVVGARFLSGLSDFVVSDIGGTTTDVASVENGWPRLDREGATVGGRRTLVRAVAMRTFGLGGDSEVTIEPNGRAVLKPGRVVPLSLLAHRFPAVLARMEAILDDPQGAPYAGLFVVRPFGAETAGTEAADLTAREREVLAAVGDTPVSMDRVVHGPTRQKALDRLVALGRLAVSGYTPSDAAHVLGLQSQWNRQGAVLGGLLLERRLRMQAASRPAEREPQAIAFAQAVFDAAVRASGRAVVAALSDAPVDALGPLVEAAVDGSGRHRGLAVTVRPAVPLVGVGGPAGVFYTELGRRLGCEVVLPPHAAVANAVGAAIGVIRARVTLEVTGAGPGLWRLHGPDVPESFVDPTAALARARALAADMARDKARAQGGSSPEIELHVDRVDVPGLGGDAGLVGATIFAEAWSAPDARH